jgi:hypothetical protein
MAQGFQRHDGELFLVDVPVVLCPTRRCGRTLEFVKEIFQSKKGDVGWLFDCPRGHRWLQIQPDGGFMKMKNNHEGR